MPDIRWLAVTDSTNERALELARAGAPHATVVVADHQRAGRGRLGRTWQDGPAGSSLLASVVVDPSGPVATAGLAVMAVSLAMADACADLSGERPGLKWPNDLVWADRKLAGVLAESIVEGTEVQALVVGVGLNLWWPEAGPPQEIAAGAVSLEEASGCRVDRDQLVRSWVDRVDTALGANVVDLLADYRRSCFTLGQAVRVSTAGGEALDGIAVDVTDAGALVLDVAIVGRRVVFSGDVVHLRAT